MLRARVNRSVSEVCAKGTLSNIEVEILTLIHSVYGMLDDCDQERFEADITDLLPMCFMSDEERNRFAKKQKEESYIDEIDKLFKEIMGYEDLGNKT